MMPNSVSEDGDISSPSLTSKESKALIPGPTLCFTSQPAVGAPKRQLMSATPAKGWNLRLDSRRFNVAIENGPFIDGYLLKMVIFHGYVE
jgi:hypothetical protein